MGRPIKILALCIPLILAMTGCSGPLLADRTILRGIFLDQTVSAGWSVTLCWDSLAEEGKVDSVSGEGDSLDEALYRARSQLDGEPFYGQLQQILVTDQISYGQLQEAGTLFTAPQMALPQVKLAVLESSWRETQEPGQILDEMEQAFKNCGITANLYEIARRQGCLVLPVMGVQGLGCRVICQDGEVLQWSEGEGQLALILAGLADRYEMEWRDGETLCVASGRGKGTFSWEDNRLEVCLWLTRAKLEGGQAAGQDQKERYRQWVCNTGATILQQAGELDADPFMFISWVKNYKLSLGRHLVVENRRPPVGLTAQVWYVP